MTKQEIGQLGEDAAVNLLISKGYKILNRNFRVGRLEIDIVALKDNFLVFVEVKTRDENFLYSPESAVNRRKQSNIINAARLYISMFKRTEEARLDVITVLHKNSQITDIKHYERAYFPRPRRF
jgi:putative endonuclease